MLNTRTDVDNMPATQSKFKLKMLLQCIVMIKLLLFKGSGANEVVCHQSEVFTRRQGTVHLYY